MAWNKLSYFPTFHLPSPAPLVIYSHNTPNSDVICRKFFTPCHISVALRSSPTALPRAVFYLQANIDIPNLCCFPLNLPCHLVSMRVPCGSMCGSICAGCVFFVFDSCPAISPGLGRSPHPPGPFILLMMTLPSPTRWTEQFIILSSRLVGSD